MARQSFHHHLPVAPPAESQNVGEPLGTTIERFAPKQSRRTFVRQTAIGGITAFAAAHGIPTFAAEGDKPSHAGVVGITAGGLNHKYDTGTYNALTLPKFMRDELDMQLLDFNTHWLTSYDEGYLHEVRGTAEEYGCFFTNLKVNHKYGDLYSADAEERATAMKNARSLVEAAKLLGARWIRFPIPRPVLGSRTETLAPHRELARYAGEQGLQLVIENNGWMRPEPDALGRLLKIVGGNVAPAPDIGNWEDDVRYEGVAKTFVGAVTCDFKVFALDAAFRHAAFDVKRCFDLAWQAGFRGPWALEHECPNDKTFVRDNRYLRDRLVEWMAAAG